MAPTLQISIPTTSTAQPSDSKPYTLYHIRLALPLRTHEVSKRYSDFVTLQEALVSETTTAPPVALPAKSWLRRTVNNEALAEERRKGLESYVKAILEAQDSRWRSCSAWRTFLNLPSGTNTLGANGTLSTTHKDETADAVGDPNAWLDVHRGVKTQLQSARSALKQRDAATTAQSQHALAAEAKASLVRAATALAQLDDGLRRMGGSSGARGQDDDAGWGTNGTKQKKALGDGELRRRKDLVAAARKEVEGLEAVLKAAATNAAKQASNASRGTTAAASAGERNALLGDATTKPAATSVSSRRVLGGAPLKETARTREQDNAGVLQLQKQIMVEQEEDVMALGKTVSRLKDMGILIGEELEIQNEMLGLVDQDVDRVQGKVDVARRRINKIR